MVHGYHCVFGFYGFWLPNDPRGSGSDYIANWELLRFGGATTIHNRGRSRSRQPHDRAMRIAAKQSLTHPAVKISGVQALAVASGFRLAGEQGGYIFHACAILPDHVHLVIGRHPRPIRQIVGHLKAQATRQLKECNQWPRTGRPLWGDHGWNVFLNDAAAVERAVLYAERNPIREGKNPQLWSFVVPFNAETGVLQRRIIVRSRKLGGAVLRRHTPNRSTSQ